MTCDVDDCAETAVVMVEPGYRLCRRHDRLWPRSAGAHPESDTKDGGR